MSQRYIGGLIYNPPGGFSGFFDGSGDYLSTPTISAIGSGEFSQEAWVYAQSNSGTPLFWDSGVGTGTFLLLNGSTNIQGGINGSTAVTATYTLPLNSWVHLVYCRSGTTLSIFANGTRVGTATVSTSSNSGSYTIGIAKDITRPFTGYICNLRFVQGSSAYDATASTITVPSGPLQAITNTQLLTCAYPTFRDGSSNNFTITVNGNTAVSAQNPFPQTQLPNPALGNQGNGVYSMSQYQALRSQNLWPAIDPYFDYVTLMLHGNGTNGAQNNTFLDSSTNNFTITRNGNTTQGTFTPYGSLWCNYFGGSSSDYIAIADNNALDFGTGDFTIEFWFNFAVSQDRAIATGWNTSGVVNGWAVDASNTGVSFTSAVNDSYVTATQSGSILNGAWNHFAAVRSGSTVTVYLNGVGGTPVTNTQSINTQSSGMMIGRSTYNPNPRPYQGYVSNFRILKGTALYTANFTPSASPLTAITNTSLLTCQSNRFIDNSSNAFTVTPNGNVSVQRFSPFAPTTPYAAGTIGGSGYFDGSGDYLSAASNAAFGFGTGDFTIEAWINVPSVAAASQAIVDTRSAGGSSAGFYFGLASATLQIFSSGSINLTGGTIVPSAWTHVAVTRSGTTVRLFVNGEQVNSTTNSTNWTDNNMLVGVATGILTPITGYISSLRVLKGTAVYTSAFTPPTAPPTNITNTSLLLNFTNGGIIDNAMMNDLETVGNAQISTSVSKFGGGSMYFDGTSDYLLIPASQNFAFGSGDFTIEFWGYNLTGAGNWGVFSFGSTPGQDFAGITMNAGGGLFLSTTGSSWTSFNVGSLVLSTNDNQWHHYAIVRNGGTLLTYKDGAQQGSVSISGSLVNNNGIGIVGAKSDALSSVLNGYLDDFRITKGYARYTGNFTPQRSQWQDQ